MIYNLLLLMIFFPFILIGFIICQIKVHYRAGEALAELLEECNK